MARETEGSARVIQAALSPGAVVGTIEHTAFPGWRFELEVTSHGAVRRLAIEPGGEDAAPPGGGVTARMLRRVPTGALVSALRRDVATLPDRRPIPGSPLAPLPGRPVEPSMGRAGLPEWVLDHVDTFAQEPRPGRRGRPDEYYAALAAEYVALVARGEVAPVKMLAGDHHLSASQVRNLLYESRRRDLLTPAPPGRSGGELTERAHALLASAEEG